MQDFARALADFVRDNQVWAAPIVMVLAFGESLAFVSLLVPAWGALVAIGALIGVSGISFWPVWLAGGIGAALGDWVSYKIGFKYKEHVAEMWPLSRYPGILLRGEEFVKKWGVPSIFIDRFFGPLRASVPLVAGLYFGRYVLRIEPLLLLGAIAGALTFTPGLAAVQEKSGSSIAVLGYSGAVAVGHVLLTTFGTVIVLLVAR